MNHPNDDAVRKLLRSAFPPVRAEMTRDLWPAVLRRLDEETLRVPWFDWLFAGVLAALLLAFPEAIPMLFYYF